jgi:ubiquitin-conjugating enzyme E2 Z
MTIFIPKETISRLLKDVKNILKNPLTENGIYYIHDDTDIMKGYALIIGPSDTPYFGGNYFFELYYPHDYPHSPPKVKFMTNGNNVRFNPNLYTCGKVCISLLNTWSGDQWTSCQSISTVLLTLCTLFCNQPLLNEPGVDKKNPDVIPYEEIIKYSNFDIAICNIIQKKPDIFLPFFENFYPFVKENFLKNFDKLIEISNIKNTEYNMTNLIVRTRFYGMNIDINYNKMIEKLNESKHFIENI